MLKKQLYRGREEDAGFTLIELVVVLVILSILAAIAIPSLTGWIKKAKESQVVMDARTVYLAAQTYVTEQYAEDGKRLESPDDGIKETILSLAGMTGKTAAIDFVVEDGSITTFSFKEHDLTATYNQKEQAWTVE